MCQADTSVIEARWKTNGVFISAPTATLSFSLGIVDPLYEVCARCRDPVVRRRALDLVSHAVLNPPLRRNDHSRYISRHVLITPFPDTACKTPAARMRMELLVRLEGWQIPYALGRGGCRDTTNSILGYTSRTASLRSLAGLFRQDSRIIRERASCWLQESCA